MQLSLIWLPIGLIAVVALGAVAVALLVRSWPKRDELSAEERAEMAATPMPALQKRAWWGLAVTLATLAIITVILMNQGAAAYWEDDSLRLTVVGIFMAGLFGYVVTLLAPLIRGNRHKLDERDRMVLSRAGAVQSGLVLIALGGWLITLTERFREQGAIPVVYLYLLFGSIVLINLIGQSLGILLGYLIGSANGEG
jgi:MFS family permease